MSSIDYLRREREIKPDRERMDTWSIILRTRESGARSRRKHFLSIEQAKAEANRESRSEREKLATAPDLNK